jgi:uncharacterized membrane protein (UPF0127 family)
MANISIKMLVTPEEKAKGLQHMYPIPSHTLFVFPDVPAGTEFHSRNVREPFDIAFLSFRGEVLDMVTMEPPKATIVAPPKSHLVIEAKEGELSRLGFQPGVVKNVTKLFPDAVGLTEGT